MATRSGFFNSVNGDRRYLASNFAEYFATFIGNGVFPNPSSGLQVVSNNNLSINVKAGKGWINGYYFINDSDAPFTLDVADGVLKRIDRIVFRLDFATRAITLGLKKGTFSAAPVAPALQRDADIYELALADITINNGVTAISQANITDQRMNSALCGIVQGTVNQVDTTTIYNQYEAWFNETRTSATQAQQVQLAQQEQEFRTWFNSIMDILDGDTAGNLASEIMRVEGRLDEHIIDYIKHPATAIATFSANQYTVNIEVSPTILMEGMGVVFLARNASTGDTTLKINTRTAYPILRPNGLPLTNIKANSYYAVRYSLVTRSFMLLGEGGEYGEATPSTVKRGVTFGTEEGLQVGDMPFLPDEFIGETFYRVKDHDLAFTANNNTAFITKDSRYLIGAVGSNIYRYDFIGKTYANLGGLGFGNYGISSVFGNDDGSRIFVCSGNTLYVYIGTSWSVVNNNVAGSSQKASSNADGTEVYVISSSANVVKIDVATKVSTTLSTLQASRYQIERTDDNCVWFISGGNVFRKVSTVDGAEIKTISFSYETLAGFSVNRTSSEDVELSYLARNSGITGYNFVINKKDGTSRTVETLNINTPFFVSSVDGKIIFLNQAGHGTRFYEIGNDAVLKISLPSSVEYKATNQVSSNAYYTNGGASFTTVVTYN